MRALAALALVATIGCASGGGEQWQPATVSATVVRACQHIAPGCYPEGGCWPEAWLVVVETGDGERYRLRLGALDCAKFTDGELVGLVGMRRGDEFRPVSLLRRRVVAPMEGPDA